LAKVIVHDWYTEIFPTKDELSLCKIGQGADTCILLLVGPQGLECHAKYRGPLLGLIERAERGETVAQRIGCKEAEDLEVTGLDGEYDIPLTPNGGEIDG